MLAVSAYASPSGNQSWTEEPWISATEVPQENRASTLSDPIAFNLSGNEPQFIRLGGLQLNYSDYISVAAFEPLFSELWIRKGAVWSRYDQVTAGEDVDLIVHTPQDGGGDIYLISYANSTIKHWNFKFPTGYHRLKLRPEESGRLFILPAQGNEPGNALILDVLPRQSEQSFSPLDVNSILMGDAFVTIKSQRIRGYDVYVDGVFFSSDTSDGSLDGIASLTIGGDKTHTITISQRDGQGGIINKNEHTKNFKRETAYTLLMD
ncbi:MAG: hypothetical protein NTU95_05765 [Methanothrix sp.]|nr:hypothetical protein [Methanothrix sp.]